MAEKDKGEVTLIEQGTAVRTSSRPGDLEARARWHLEIGYPTLEGEASEAAREYVDHDEHLDNHLCLDCGQPDGICECHVGDECGRWRNGDLTHSCSKAGSEECDFECPYRNTLRF